MSENKIRYQWIKGENQGTVEEFLEEEGFFIKFASGRRCNKNLIDEYVIQIQDDTEILPFENEPELKIIPKKKNIDLITKKEKALAPKNPLLPLLDKAKTKNTNLYISIGMELPSKEFISVMEDSFEDDIMDTLSEYLVSKIEDPFTFIKQHISKSLKIPVH